MLVLGRVITEILGPFLVAKFSGDDHIYPQFPPRFGYRVPTSSTIEKSDRRYHCPGGPGEQQEGKKNPLRSQIYQV